MMLKNSPRLLSADTADLMEALRPATRTLLGPVDQVDRASLLWMLTRPYADVDPLVLAQLAGDPAPQRNTKRKSRTPSLPERCVPGYGLFDHQEAAVGEVLDHLGRGTHACMLHMPTGSGKTRTGMHVVARTLASRPGLVIWLGHTLELVEQAYQQFRLAWSHHGNRPVSIFRGGQLGACKPGSFPSKADGILFCTPQLLASWKTGKDTKEHFQGWAEGLTLVVFDEAHRATAPTYLSAVSAVRYFNPKVALLGLSATPGRALADEGADEELSRAFGKKKVTLRFEGYDSPIRYLQDRGFLAELKVDVVTTNEKSVTTETDPDDARVLEKLGSSLERNQLVVMTARRLAQRNRRSIVFMPSVESSRAVASALSYHQVASQCVHGQSGPEQRQDAISWYSEADSEARVLVNCEVLTTGFDAPATSGVLVGRPTKSPVLLSQMIGRALRGPQAGGNRIAEVVSLADPGLEALHDPSDVFTYWEGSWQ